MVALIKSRRCKATELAIELTNIQKQVEDSHLTLAKQWAEAQQQDEYIAWLEVIVASVGTLADA